MTWTRPLVLAVVVSGSSAVQCNQTSPGAIDGKVDGGGFTPVEAFFFPLSYAPTTNISLVNKAGICGYLAPNESFKNLVHLDLLITPTLSAPGTFQIDSSGALVVVWNAYDDACNTWDAHATAGAVTITSVTSTEIQGSFDLTFGGDHVTGTFDASLCSPVQDASGPPVCN